MQLHRRSFVLATTAASLAASVAPWFASAARADEKPSFYHGEIPDAPLAHGRAARILGHSGVLLIRSQPHLNWVMQGLYAAGLPVPKGEAPFGADFAKQVIVVVLHYGEDDHRFHVRQIADNETRAKVDVAMGYVRNKLRGRGSNQTQILAIPAPKRDATDVSISTFPYEANQPAKPENAVKEWSHDFSSDRGDLVDGLHSRLRPEKREVAKGDDIRFEFELDFHSPMKEAGQFAQAPESAVVWDGKYSNGYRNHAFLVELPDGSSRIVRPEQKGFDKNVPRPVIVSAGKPYVLPEWAEEERFKSLKQLGLETKMPGKYTITGLYAQTADEPALIRRGMMMWSGRIATAPVVITVK